MSETRNGAQVAVESLRREGVGYVFGLPGTTIMNLIDAFARQDEIRYISTRHEQVAAFMADGYARGSGGIGVCMASRGPGAANMTIGLHNSYAESVPVLALVGQVADDIYHREAFEEMDLVRFFEPITKWSLEIHKAGRIPELLQRAVRTALGDRSRPVMVSIPLDVQMQPVPEPGFQPRFRHRGAVPEGSEVEAAAKLLEASERPVMILGGGSLSSGANAPAVRLAETLRMPVVTTWLRKDAFPNRHELFFGSLGFGAAETTERLVREADVIIAVGCHFSEFATKRWTLLSPGSRLIHVDSDPEEIGKVYVPEIGLQGDARLTLDALLEVVSGLELRAGPADERERRRRESRAPYEEETRLPEERDAEPGVPSGAVVRALQYVLDSYPAIVVQDAPTFGVWMQKYLLFDEPGSYYAAAGGSMGWGLPASFGLQLARPEERVIGVIGDGAFWMVAQDLETAVREGIPTVTIITNNFAYGNTRDRQKSAHGGRYLGVFYENPDFAKFAELLGAHGERVEKAEELLPAVKRALAAGRPAVIDVIQDRHEGLPPGLAPPEAK
ncbi:acetolactate synthase [Rubrobacter marinus]|uniref:Acetolactate synthase n=1 Tax=Rubrobacter marinus TaxID=2653852 RepID=A0A6G8Q0R1_9ACTN|nr:thiamine pyrophosphate-binding protein [Rubrobacter marinus]QIN80010.1 acetolactate synthase [Rubrobacter marinus]